MEFLNPSYVIMAVGNISIKFASAWAWLVPSTSHFIIRKKYSKTRLYLMYTTVNTIHSINTEERVTENGIQNFAKHSLSYDLRFLIMFTIVWLGQSSCAHRNTSTSATICDCFIQLRNLNDGHEH